MKKKKKTNIPALVARPPPSSARGVQIGSSSPSPSGHQMGGMNGQKMPSTTVAPQQTGFGQVVS